MFQALRSDHDYERSCQLRSQCIFHIGFGISVLFLEETTSGQKILRVRR
jgi:hypothetical protein